MPFPPGRRPRPLTLFRGRPCRLQNPESRKGLVEATKMHEFVRFVMFLINDTTWCLGEGTLSRKAGWAPKGKP